MKNIARIALLALTLSSSALANAPFPSEPDSTLTPGSLCDRPDAKRYPERIPYCSRGVGGALKREVMQTYDARLGYRITSMNRSEFKIDHYIPLCMGGSNHSNNLWPQHSSVYAITDPLEQLACMKMAEGKLLQAKAVELIKEAKGDLAAASRITAYLNSLR